MTEPSQYFKGRTVQEQMNEVIGYVDVRSAEVAVDAIAGDMATIHQEKLDAEAAATNAAASAAAAAGTLANAVKKTGESSQTVEGDITMSTGDLGVAGNVNVGGDLGVTGTVTVPTPVNNTDAANKKYVDDALDNYAPMIRTTGSQVAAGNKYMNAVTYIGSAAASGDTGYSLIADLGTIAAVNFAFIAVSRSGTLMGAINVDASGIPTYSGVGIAGSTSFGIALKDGNMYIAMKRIGSSGQNYTINIIGASKGTSHLTIQPYDGNAPVENVDSFTEACKI